MYGKLKLTVLFILIFLSQNVAGQDLERYFIEYLEEGNVDRITEVIDLGLDVNNAQIKKKSVLDYVFDNSEDASITMSVLDVLVEAGVNLNNYPIRFRKILDDRDTIFIDYFLSNGFSATSINIPNQNSLSTTYLKYLKEKGFKINDDIIKKRELNLDIVNFRNYLKTRNTKSVIKELEKPFMDNLRLNHMDLFYAIKTLDTIVINKVLEKSSRVVLKTPYLKDWDVSIYGNEPKDFDKSHYPIRWAMGTNELFIVKHFLRKGANPINDGNPESSPAIQSYVNSLFRNRWHLSLNKLYTINLSKLPNPTVYEVPRGSLLREIVNKKIMKEIESYARYASKADDNIFMASFKFLKKGKTISQIYVETTNVEASLELKEFLNTEKPFFENLFKRIKKDQIYCDFKVRF